MISLPGIGCRLEGRNPAMHPSHTTQLRMSGRGARPRSPSGSSTCVRTIMVDASLDASYVAIHNEVSVREYLEYQCDYAGVGLEAVTDRDIGLAILAPDYAAQWVAIRSILQRNQEAEDKASARIRELEADIRAHGYAQHWVDHHWVTQMHGKNFLDAAHSMAAVGLIAPLMESLFGRIVRYFQGRADMAE